MTTKDIGDIGERAAARFLKKNGYRIKGRNKHFSHNEIDIIAEDKDHIVFAEVKTRSVSQECDIISPAAAVTYKKQAHLISGAYAYLKANRSLKQPRMDVIEVLLDKNTQKVIKINHIIDAYGVR